MIVCDSCGETFLNQTDLKKHSLAKHSNLKPYTCDKCGESFKHRRNLKIHNMYKHQDNSLRTCPICLKEEKCAADLVRHYESSHSGYPPLQIDEKYVFRCDLCLKVLGSKPALYTHKKKTHNIRDVYKKTNLGYAK
jgi:uncharacterized Zn-finger protein